MKRLMAVALYGVMGCVAMAQAIPDKIYVNRYSSEKRVEVVGGAYVDSMRIKLGNVKLYESVGLSIEENIQAFLDGKLSVVTDIHPGFHGHGGH